MTRTIYPPDESKIARAIRDWPNNSPLNWDLVCKVAQPILGWPVPPTRQGLDKKPLIKIAYRAKKAQIRRDKQKEINRPKPRSLEDASQTISRLTSENEQLKLEISKMAEIAQRFIYNASLKGMKPDQLMTPLPSIRDK